MQVTTVSYPFDFVKASKTLQGIITKTQLDFSQSLSKK